MIIAANWKMNLNKQATKSLITILANHLSYKNEVILFPSFTLIEYVKNLTEDGRIKLGAQNCADEASGAFTGEVSASQIAESGCSHVILGHSERRKYFNETNEQINKKTKIAIENNLRPLVCIGETLEERKQNKTLQVIKAQLDKIYDNIDATKTTIAYEPVWAIGTGLTPKNSEIIEVHQFISEYFSEKIEILYGGSVNEANSDEIMSLQYVSGVLVGGASLVPDKFIKIANFLQK